MRWGVLAGWALLAAAALGALSGCEEESCVTAGCAAGQICDRTTGACGAPPTPSCEQVTCAAGQTCDVATGMCVERATFCREPGDPCEGDACTTCAAGLTCDVASGLCVGACAFVSCSKAEVCDEVTQECRPVACARDNECPEGAVCDGERCRIGCRSGAACREGEYCEQSPGGVGSCRTICASDDACPWGQRCVQAGGRSRCEAEAPCADDAACRSGEACLLGQCQRELCASDAECGESGQEYCDLDTGRCRLDICLPDSFEPNSAALIREILPGSYAGLTLCRGEEDWYALRLETAQASGQALRVRLFHADNADLDVEALQGGRVVARGGLATSPEELYLPPGALEEVTLRVYAARGVDLAYRLTLEESEPLCLEDAAEPNDSAGEALPLGVGASPVVTCPGSPDFFALRAASGGGLRVTLTRADGFSASDWVTWAQLDGDSVELTPQSSAVRVVEIAWMSPEATLLIAAESFTRVPWTLEAAAVEVPCADEGAGDAAPEAAALELESGAAHVEDASICPRRGALEEDWYVLTGLPEGALQLEAELLMSDAAQGRVALLTGAETLPWRAGVTPPGGGAGLSAALSRLDRPIYLRVDDPAGLAAARLAWPRYGLSARASALTGRCVEDWSEGSGNDTAATATRLEVGAELRALLCGANPDVVELELTPGLQLKAQAEDVAVRYTIFDAPEAPPLAGGLLEPGAGQVEVLAGAGLPPGTARVWVRLSAEEDPGDAGAAYTLTPSDP